MQAKAFLMLTGVQIETYTTHILKHIPFQYHLLHTFTHTHLLPLPKKNRPKQVTEKALR